MECMEHDAEPREELQTVQTALDHEVPVLAAVAETVEVDSAERVVVALAAAAGGEVIDWAAVAMGFEGGVVDNLVAVVEMRAV